MKTTHPVLFLPLLAGLAASLSAAERTWDGGGATSDWNVAMNWDGNTALNPAADNLTFPTGLAITEKTSNNNYPVDTQFRSIKFLEGGYTMTGTVMELTNGITGSFATGSVNIGASFKLMGPQSFTASFGGDLNFTGTSQIFLNGQQLNFAASDPDSVLTVGGVLSGPLASGVTVSGSGKTWFKGARNYPGDITVTTGNLYIDHDGSLGTMTGKTLVENGSLHLSSVSPLTVNEDITLDASGIGFVESILGSDSGDHSITGPIMLSGDGVVIDVDSGSLTLSGPVTSGLVNHFHKIGSGTLAFAGAAVNTLGHVLHVDDGLVRLQKPAGSNGLWVGVIGLEDEIHPAELRLMAGEQIQNGANISIYGSGLFNLNGFTETVEWILMHGGARITTGAGILNVNTINVYDQSPHATATITGNVRLTGPSLWQILSSGTADALPELVVTGPILGGGPAARLKMNGNGDLRLAGNNTVPMIEVTNGTMYLAGNSPQTDVRVYEFGKVHASGAVKDLNGEAGVVNIGDFGSNGALTCRNLSITGDGTCAFSYTGNAPGGHDVCHVNGTVTLGPDAQAAIAQTGVVSLAVSEEVILIDNDGSDPIAGVFKNFAEGSIVDGEYYLSYRGGDGNDLSITRIVPPTGTTRTWDGGGNDNNWMTAANWNNNVAPQPGDTLIFPVNAQRKTNTNNYPADTTFHSITFQSGDYSVTGARIMVNSRIISMHTGNGGSLLATPVKFALPANVYADAGTFRLSGAIDTNGKIITAYKADGAGQLNFSSTVSGTGGITKEGPGMFYLFGNNTFTGPVHIKEGTVQLFQSNGLGTDDGNTTIDEGATLRLDAPIDAYDLGEPIVLAGTLHNVGPNLNQFHGAMTVVGSHATFRSEIFSYFGYTVSGTGALHKTGPSPVSMAMGSANTFTGGFYADEGKVIVGKAAGVTLPGPVYIATVPGLYAQIEFGAANQIGDNALVQVDTGGTLQPRSYNDTVGSVVLNGGWLWADTATLTVSSGNITVGPDSQISLFYCNLNVPQGVTGHFHITGGTSAESDLAYKGVIHADLVEQTGAGVMTWYDDMPANAVPILDIKGGMCLVDGNCPGLAVKLKGGTLAGNGRVASVQTVTSGGLMPGLTPGVANDGKFMTIADVTLNASTDCTFKIDGLSPADDYNVLFPTHSFALNGANLKLDVAGYYYPAPGERFMIVRSTVGTPAVGTFAGIPEGGYVSVPGAKIFQVTYKGGDGDDVELIYVEKPAPKVTAFDVSPVDKPNPVDNDVHVQVQGVPGLAYQLESSSDLVQWQLVKSGGADLVTGLVEFDFVTSMNIPRLFFRARLP